MLSTRKEDKTTDNDVVILNAPLPAMFEPINKHLEAVKTGKPIFPLRTPKTISKSKFFVEDASILVVKFLMLVFGVLQTIIPCVYYEQKTKKTSHQEVLFPLHKIPQGLRKEVKLSKMTTSIRDYPVLLVINMDFCNHWMVSFYLGQYYACE